MGTPRVRLLGVVEFAGLGELGGLAGVAVTSSASARCVAPVPNSADAIAARSKELCYPRSPMCLARLHNATSSARPMTSYTAEQAPTAT